MKFKELREMKTNAEILGIKEKGNTQQTRLYHLVTNFSRVDGKEVCVTQCERPWRVQGTTDMQKEENSVNPFREMDELMYSFYPWPQTWKKFLTVYWQGYGST